MQSFILPWLSFKFASSKYPFLLKLVSVWKFEVETCCLWIVIWQLISLCICAFMWFFVWCNHWCVWFCARHFLFREICVLCHIHCMEHVNMLFCVFGKICVFCHFILCETLFCLLVWWEFLLPLTYDLLSSHPAMQLSEQHCSALLVHGITSIRRRTGPKY